MFGPSATPPGAKLSGSGQTGPPGTPLFVPVKKLMVCAAVFAMARSVKPSPLKSLCRHRARALPFNKGPGLG